MNVTEFARKLRAALSYLRRGTLRSRFVPWAANPYATHLPVLIGLAMLTRPRHVLELGGGLISTPALADKRIFPTVESLHTVEDNMDWARKVEAAVEGVGHARVERTDSVPELADRMDLSQYDLIFIDDSDRDVDRARTIRAILSRCPPRANVVIHDFEWRIYRRAVPARWHRFTLLVWRPTTGVIWREGLVPQQLKRLLAALARGQHIPLNDAVAWRNHLQLELG